MSLTLRWSWGGAPSAAHQELHRFFPSSLNSQDVAPKSASPVSGRWGRGDRGELPPFSWRAGDRELGERADSFASRGA